MTYRNLKALVPKTASSQDFPFLRSPAINGARTEVQAILLIICPTGFLKIYIPLTNKLLSDCARATSQI
jgi:hypothetical protein